MTRYFLADSRLCMIVIYSVVSRLAKPSLIATSLAIAAPIRAIAPIRFWRRLTDAFALARTEIALRARLELLAMQAGSD